MAKRKHKGDPRLFTNGAGKVADYEYGVLRATYDGRAQTALDYAASKLGVAAADPVWAPKRDYGVVIPRAAADGFRDARELWTRYEAARLPRQRDLAIALTLWTPGAPALRDAFEAARAWALEAFAHRRRLPALVVQHNPAAAGSRNDPHLHLVVAARELGPYGFGAFSDLCRDGPLLALHAEWRAHLEAWGRR